MFGLVAIAILACCLFIDMSSGDFARAGTAVVIVVIILIWLACEDAKEKREKREAEERQAEANRRYEITKARAMEILKENPRMLFKDAYNQAKKELWKEDA